MEKERNMEHLSGILIFEINKKELCLELEDVRAILTYAEYSDLLGVKLKIDKDFVLNNQNVIMIKIDSIKGYKDITKSSRLIVLDAKEKSYGIWADSIKEIRILESGENENFKEKLKKSLEDKNNTVIKSVVKFDDRILMIPNYDKTNFPEWVINELYI